MMKRKTRLSRGCKSKSKHEVIFEEMRKGIVA